jgi:hypothetical protein
MKGHVDESGGRILLGYNTDISAVMLRPVRFHCVECGSQLDCVVSIHVQLSKIGLAPDLTDRTVAYVGECPYLIDCITPLSLIAIVWYGGDCYRDSLVLIGWRLYAHHVNPASGRGSVVGIATCYGLDGPGIESRWGGARFSAADRTYPGTHPAPCTLGPGSLSRDKASGVALTIHYHPSSAEDSVNP